MPKARLIVGFLGVLGLGTGCEGPCRTLAQRICECSASPNEQRACEIRVDNNANGRQPTSADEETCEDLLDSCSCRALELGERHLCGLTDDPLPPAPDPRDDTTGPEPTAGGGAS